MNMNGVEFLQSSILSEGKSDRFEYIRKTNNIVTMAILDYCSIKTASRFKLIIVDAAEKEYGEVRWWPFTPTSDEILIITRHLKSDSSPKKLVIDLDKESVFRSHIVL